MDVYLDSRMSKQSDLIWVCRENIACCVVVAEFRLLQFEVVINHSLKVLPYAATLKSLHCLSLWSASTWGCRADVFETEQVILEPVESFWFLLVLWTSCNELFNTFGDVCDEVVFHSSIFQDSCISFKAHEHQDV